MFFFYFLVSSYYRIQTGFAQRPSFGMYDCFGNETSLLNCPRSYLWRQNLFIDDYYCSKDRVIGLNCPSMPGLLLN